MEDKDKILQILKETWHDSEYITSGGNSWVYSATISDKKNAIKVFRRFNEEGRYIRFNKEVKIIKSLHGIPGIISINSCNQNTPDKPLGIKSIKRLSDIAYFTMDYFPNNLNKKLSDYSQDDGTLAVNAMIDIATIINRLHNHTNNYAHRDLKPDNILVDSENNLFVSDYGLSIDLAETTQNEHRLTAEGEQIGSLAYRSPELLRGRLDHSDHRPCDIFALGRILWTLLFCKEPYGITDLEFQETSVNSTGRTIKNPARLDYIIRSAASVDPKYRMTIEQFIESLNNWKMSSDKEGYSNMIDKILNNEVTISTAEFFKRVDDIRKKHNETMSYVTTQLDDLTKGWRKIANAYQENGGRLGNACQASTVSYYSPDFAPEVLKFEKFEGVPDGVFIRFNLGGNSAAPRLHLALYIQFNSQNWEDQKFLVLGAYIPKGKDISKGNSENSIILTKSKTRIFNYKDSDIGERMINELYEGFQLLDKVFKEEVLK